MLYLAQHATRQVLQCLSDTSTTSRGRSEDELLQGAPVEYSRRHTLLIAGLGFQPWNAF
jgi:hypothetical protein